MKGWKAEQKAQKQAQTAVGQEKQEKRSGPKNRRQPVKGTGRGREKSNG